ncbi:MAG: elongation factor P maturation arginine rhamnosyltransferase EarP [Burkholderiaceae bacterium]
MLWDIFCKVIDNHGDLGVCWRLSVALAARGETVRLWVDDPSALAWMAPQGAPGVEVLRWAEGVVPPSPGEVLVEAFGCEPPDTFVAERARRAGLLLPRSWVNLEYLTAESFAERSHGLPSPVMSGPGRGLMKHFFYPGFTPRTGGLLRERGLLERRAAFDEDAWLRSRGIERGPDEILVSLFCYEPPALAALMDQLARSATPVRLLATPGRATAAVEALGHRALPPLARLPFLPQTEYDHLLWSCDFNFVRGEDSLVRALWAGKPFAWQIYPQEDDAHHLKLSAFLEVTQAPPEAAAFHAGWNGLQAGLTDFHAMRAAAAPWAQRTRSALAGQGDLASQLMAFVG